MFKKGHIGYKFWLGKKRPEVKDWLKCPPEISRKNLKEYMKTHGAWSKGIRVTEEVRKKLMKIGFKKGSSPWNKGKKTGLIPKSVFKNGQVAPMKGKQNIKISKENHWNWQGGITAKHFCLRHSLEYKLWREAVFARDNYTCKNCAEKGVFLNAHHSIPFHKLMGTPFEKYIFDVRNGITLCERCHFL